MSLHTIGRPPDVADRRLLVGVTSLIVHRRIAAPCTSGDCALAWTSITPRVYAEPGASPVPAPARSRRRMIRKAIAISAVVIAPEITIDAAG